MLGLREADEPISELRADPNHPSQVAVWSAVHQYFDGRIQSMPQQMPGRTPDLSGPASAVMKAVLKEVGAGVCSWQPWAAYEDYMKSLGLSGNNDMQSRAEGAAGGHTHEARFEAAHRLIHNHEMVVRDICNPSTETNIEGKPLTQLELQRVPPSERKYVDQCLREVTPLECGLIFRRCRRSASTLRMQSRRRRATRPPLRPHPGEPAADARTPARFQPSGRRGDQGGPPRD